MDRKVEDRPLRRPAYAGIKMPCQQISFSEVNMLSNRNSLTEQKTNKPFEVFSNCDMTISEECEDQVNDSMNIRGTVAYTRDILAFDERNVTDMGAKDKREHDKKSEKGFVQFEKETKNQAEDNSYHCQLKEQTSQENGNSGLEIQINRRPACIEKIQTLKRTGKLDCAVGNIKTEDIKSKMIRRHSTMTLIGQQSAIRRDSVVVMKARKSSSFTDCQPTATAVRKTSLAVPQKPKRKPSLLNAAIHITDKTRAQKSNASKVTERVTKTEDVSMVLNLSFTKLTNNNNVKIIVDLDKIKSAIRQQSNVQTLQINESSDNKHEFTCKCGEKVTVVCGDRIYTDNNNYQIHFGKELNFGKDNSEDIMPPNNYGHADLHSRRMSIEEVIENLKMKPYVYECQLAGCKRLGKFAYGDEDLGVTLSQQDCVMCLLKAMKTFPDRPDLLKSAAKSLAKLTSVYEASSCHICSNDGIQILMKIFHSYHDNAELLLLIIDILGNVSINEDLLEDLIHQSVHSEMLTTMSRHSDNKTIAKQCCFILGNVVNSVEVAQSLMFVGGVHAIISTMERFYDNEEVIENGCRTLGCFAMHDEICQDVANAGAVKVVLAGMRLATDNHSVQESGCWALACLTKIDDCCNEMRNAGGINIVTSAMERFDKEEVVQEYGCWIISNLSATESIVDDMAKNSIFEKLTSAMVMYPENIQMQQQICFAISQIATCEEIEDRLVYRGHVKNIVNVMTSFPDDPEIQEYGCRIIGNVAVNETLRKTINCGCTSKAVIAAMLTLDRLQQVQEYGCMALTNLTANALDNKAQVVENGGVAAVMNTLKEFSLDETVTLCVVKALANFMEIEIASSHFITEEGLDMISEIFKRFSTSSEIRLFICIILSNISTSNVLEQTEELLYKALDESGNNPEIQLCICQFYEKLVMTGYGCERFLKQRKISTIMSAMKHHPANIDIQYSGCKIIAAVSMYNGKGMSIINDEVVNLVVSTMKKIDASEVQTVCCGILSYVIENTENTDILYESSGIDAIMKAMRNNKNEERLQVVGMMALESLRKNGTIDQSVINGDFELTVKIMEKFPDNTELQIYGCNILCLAGNTVTANVDIRRKALSIITDILRRNKTTKELQMSATNCLPVLLKGEAEDTILQLQNKIPSFHDSMWEQILLRKQTLT